MRFWRSSHGLPGVRAAAYEAANRYRFTCGGRPAKLSLFNLISRLQFTGTMPMVDVQAYWRWLSQ
jgi:hypothetical protein